MISLIRKTLNEPISALLAFGLYYVGIRAGCFMLALLLFFGIIKPLDIAMSDPLLEWIISGYYMICLASILLSWHVIWKNAQHSRYPFLSGCILRGLVFIETILVFGYAFVFG